MLNVKQGSCEYQFLKSFGPTRPGNRVSVSDFEIHVPGLTLTKDMRLHQEGRRGIKQVSQRSKKV